MTEVAIAKKPSAVEEGLQRAPVLRQYAPDVDIVETAEELVLYADLPGVDPKQLDLDFENGFLTLRGPVAPRQAADTRYLLREYGLGEFKRTFRVDERIDAAGISAESRNGVLVLRLPKSAAVKPRKIDVKAR